MTKHALNYEDNTLKITGVTEVKSFEDKEISAILDEGGIIIKGANLNVEELNLTSGVLTIKGVVYSISYSAGMEKGGFIKKLFK